MKFKPYELAYLRGADDKVMQLIECISMPWEENGKELIKIRLTPNDAATLGETETNNLLKLPKKVRCTKHEESFNGCAIRPYPCDSSFTLEWTCPICGRGYFLITEITKKNWFYDPDEEVGEWHGDRKLEVEYDV